MYIRFTTLPIETNFVKKYGSHIGFTNKGTIFAKFQCHKSIPCHQKHRVWDQNQVSNIIIEGVMVNFSTSYFNTAAILDFYQISDLSSAKILLDFKIWFIVVSRSPNELRNLLNQFFPTCVKIFNFRILDHIHC